jgi:flagellar motor protein MotB
MIKTTSSGVLAGYGAGEIDFNVRLEQSSEQARISVDDKIFFPLLAVLDSPDQSAVLVIIGHSDRVDTEGLTREQRRQQELKVSEDRAHNAFEAVKQIIRENFPEFVPLDISDLPQLTFVIISSGAAVLLEPAEVLSEEQRSLNRRVQMALVRYQPG